MCPEKHFEYQLFGVFMFNSGLGNLNNVQNLLGIESVLSDELMSIWLQDNNNYKRNKNPVERCYTNVV